MALLDQEVIIGLPLQAIYVSFPMPIFADDAEHMHR